MADACRTAFEHGGFPCTLWFKINIERDKTLMTDVIVIGGGVIGLSIAYELVGQGASVRVVEQGAFGREASWAGAGMLPPGNLDFAQTPEAQLRGLSASLWSGLSAQLREETGIDNGFLNSGAIELGFGGSADELDPLVERWRGEGVTVEPLNSAQLFALESAISTQATAAFRLPDFCQARNPRHLKALLAACAERGVVLDANKPVIGFDFHDSAATGVMTPGETLRAGRFCVAGGAWTKSLLTPLGFEVAIEPIRGQVVMLSMPRTPFRHAIEVGSRYLVPRPDGRVLVGSTVEYVGFDRQNTAEGVRELIDFALDLVPVLAQADVERTWAGLRPGSADGLPYLGRVPGTENVFVAAGHFRSGLQMSPGTAIVMRDLILDGEPTISLEPFACDRSHVGSL